VLKTGPRTGKRISRRRQTPRRTTWPLSETFLREAAGERVRAGAHGTVLCAVATGRQVGLEAAHGEGEAMSCCHVSARGVEGAGHGLSSPLYPSLQKGECCWDCLSTGRARSPSTASDASGASTCLADHSREGSPARKSSGTSDPAGLREAAPRVDVVDLTKCDADSDRGAPEMPDELQGETFSMNRGILPRLRKRGM